MLLDRLKMIEQIHLQSPNLTLQVAKIKLNAAKDVPEALARERKLIEETRDVTLKSLSEIEKVV